MEANYYSETLEDYGGERVISAGAIDVPTLLITLLLLTVGVIMVLSASFARAIYNTGETGGSATYYFSKQMLFAGLGVVAMLIVSRIPTRLFFSMSYLVLISAIALLALVPFVGVSAGGAKRWIDLGFTTFQPSEIAKLGVILVFARRLSVRQKRLKYFRDLIPYVAILVAIVGLLLLEPHLSASVIIIGLGLIMLFIGGAKLSWFIFGGTLLAAAGYVVINFLDYASSRVEAWLDPFASSGDEGYQIVQSLLAIGSGGLTGLGLGQSRQKYLYLPEEHNDFIFAVVCEELGFIGAVLILALFAMLIIRGYWIALHTKDKYSFYLCAGVTTLIAIQVILNVAVCTNLIPCTGISLPFFSYGGTALLIQMAEIGILLSVSREIPTVK